MSDSQMRLIKTTSRRPTPSEEILKGWATDSKGYTWSAQVVLEDHTKGSAEGYGSARMAEDAAISDARNK